MADRHDVVCRQIEEECGPQTEKWLSMLLRKAPQYGFLLAC